MLSNLDQSSPTCVALWPVTAMKHSTHHLCRMHIVSADPKVREPNASLPEILHNSARRRILLRPTDALMKMCCT